ncbi:hypothetical protein HPB48_009494 [Haemaphysalis longicornis]|uniref:Uncharacterized protein n=1 Tax=Haemaphysalis longicornis TaxID=44386 RepID=A0A9J6GF93_HAELO|nr:hypothetical protein HPB48_009494 [Haemaphysalis longicornis]
MCSHFFRQQLWLERTGSPRECHRCKRKDEWTLDISNFSPVSGIFSSCRFNKPRPRQAGSLNLTWKRTAATRDDRHVLRAPASPGSCSAFASGTGPLALPYH